MKTPIASLCLFFTLAVSHATAQNIQINTKVFSIPTDSPALKEAGLTVDAAEGQSNLGVVSFDRATAMLAKLEKAPGVQILSHPTFTTRSGQQATIEGIREFIYATEFKASQLTNATEAKPTQLASSQIVAATPATPSAFEMRPIGFRMEIDPVITPRRRDQCRHASRADFLRRLCELWQSHQSRSRRQRWQTSRSHLDSKSNHPAALLQLQG